MNITLPFLLHFSLALFIASIWGIIVIRKNLISILIAIELLLLSASLNFIFFSVMLDDILGQVFALLILGSWCRICHRVSHCRYFIVLRLIFPLMISSLKVNLKH
jgi:NADH:ubiquinone oxidoreductase subunit K